MERKVIVDSCCDLNKELKEEKDIRQVPLTISVNGKDYIDDENLSILTLLKEIKDSPTTPKTACPSPNDYMENFDKNAENFVITLSNKLSGSYNSACLARDIFMENNPGSFVYVINSKSASIGETLICLKLNEYLEQKLERKELIEKIENYVSKMKTIFILESLDTLIKAGRIGKLQGKIASILSIIPIMKATEHGEIDLYEKVRGVKKAFNRLVDIIEEHGEVSENKILGIAHCNCLDRALELKSNIEKKYKFKDIVIMGTQGISTVYANDGGIIIAY